MAKKLVYVPSYKREKGCIHTVADGFMEVVKANEEVFIDDPRLVRLAEILERKGVVEIEHQLFSGGVVVKKNGFEPGYAGF